MVVDGCWRLRAYGFHDPICLQTDLFEYLRDVLDGVGFEPVQTALIARDQDRAPGVDGLSVAESGTAARLGLCGMVRMCIGSLSLGGVGGWFPRSQSEGKGSRQGRGGVAAGSRWVLMFGGLEGR